MTITGTIHHIGQLETVGSNGFTKQLLVVKTDQQYDNLIPIEFVKDKTALLTTLTVGQEVTVHINLGGREWNGKYFPSVRGWKIEAQSAAPQPVPVPSAPMGGDDEDSLPF